MGRAPPSEQLAILCVGLDPFLLRMVRSTHPEAEIREAHAPDELLQELCREPDAIVQVPTNDARVVVGSEFEDRVVAIVDPRSRGDVTQVTDGAGTVLVRPVDPRTLRVAIAAAAGQLPGFVDRMRQRIRRLDLTWTPESLFAAIRFVLSVTVALDVMGLAVLRDQAVDPWVGLAMVTLIVHAAWRLRHRWLQVPFLIGDVVIAVGAGIVSPIHPSPALLLIVLAASQFGIVDSAMGMVGVLTAMAGVITLAVVGGVDAVLAVAMVALVLTAALLGVSMAEVVLRRSHTSRRALLDIHGALRDLHEHAQANPARLHATTLRSDILQVAMDGLGADRVALACGAPETWHRPLVRGFTPGTHRGDRDVHTRIVNLRGPQVVDDEVLNQLVHGGHVLVAPLRFDGLVLGALLAAWDEPLTRWEERRLLLEIGELSVDAALALDSADLFSAVDHLSVSGERQRIARDLHDGIVQSFVHVGLELDRLADELTDTDLPSALRILQLRNVVHGAVMDTRSVIGRLRLRNLDEGLRPALQAYLAESRAFAGPEVELEWGLQGDVAAELVPDLFRFVQEALANVRQHAEATHAMVRVRRRSRAVQVEVIDDGCGLVSSPSSPAEPLRGRGLPAMRERLELLGGRLEIRSDPGRGTTLRAIVPDAHVDLPSIGHVPQESLR